MRGGYCRDPRRTQDATDARQQPSPLQSSPLYAHGRATIGCDRPLIDITDTFQRAGPQWRGLRPDGVSPHAGRSAWLRDPVLAADDAGPEATTAARPAAARPAATAPAATDRPRAKRG